MQKQLIFHVQVIMALIYYIIIKCIYLTKVAFKYRLIGFGPEVCFAIVRGNIIFATNIDVFIIIMSSFDTPASISFKGDTLSVAANPIFLRTKKCTELN